MKKNICLTGALLFSCLLFVSFSPSLDGRAVVAEEGVLPQGIFAKTVGYLPGDSISVTNLTNKSTVDVLVIGAIDPSEGVAILLSPEAASLLGLERGANSVVKITKRTGQLDEFVSGTAVIGQGGKETDAEAEAEAEAGTDADESGDYGYDDYDGYDGYDDYDSDYDAPEEEAFPEDGEEESSDGEEYEEYEESAEPEETGAEEEAFEADTLPEDGGGPYDGYDGGGEEAVSPDSFEDEEDAEQIDAVPVPEAAVVPPEAEPVSAEELPEPYEEVAAEPFREEDVPPLSDDEVLPEKTEFDAPPEIADGEPDAAADTAGAEEEALPDAEILSPVPEAAPETAEVTEEEYVSDDGVLPEPEGDSEEGAVPEPESGGESYEPIVLIPAEPNPPVSGSAGEAEASEEETPAETGAAETPAAPAAENGGKDSGFGYEEYTVPSLKDLQSGSYYVQIAVLKDRGNIQEVFRKYGGQYPITLVPLASGAAVQVLIGPLTVDEYGTVLNRFKSYGFKDAFLRKIR